MYILLFGCDIFSEGLLECVLDRGPVPCRVAIGCGASLPWCAACCTLLFCHGDSGVGSNKVGGGGLIYKWLGSTILGLWGCDVLIEKD